MMRGEMELFDDLEAGTAWTCVMLAWKCHTSVYMGASRRSHFFKYVKKTRLLKVSKARLDAANVLRAASASHCASHPPSPLLRR